LSGRPAAPLARDAGIAPQTFDGYLKGAIPAADRAFAIADALGVDPRWLVMGVGERAPAPIGESEDGDWLLLPAYDVAGFGEYGKPEPRERVRIRRDWLMGVNVRMTDSLWLTDMPGDAMPEVAREGQMLVCQDPAATLMDGRVYIFLLDGRPLVRKVYMRPEGLMLTTNDRNIEPIILTEDRADQLIPVARVLAAINLSPV
jgi:transcriptional regulator with XRE-family HTH domain